MSNPKYIGLSKMLVMFGAISALLLSTSYANWGGEEEVLFVQTSKSGSLTIINSADNSYKLDLKSFNPSVSYFSDRPYRDTGSMDVKDFITLWNQDRTGSFKNDPPNTVFIYNNDLGQHIAVIEISNPVYNSITKVMTYIVTPLEENQLEVGEFDNAVLVIDPVNDDDRMGL